MGERELPEGWKLVSLGDENFFKRYGGSTPSKSQSEYWNNGVIPWLSNTELKGNAVNFVSSTCEKITQKGLDNCSASLLPKNCVLLTCTASIGKVGINEIELATNQQFNSFQCSEEVLPKYLAFFLLTQKNNLTKLGGSTSFCHINTKNLGTLKIPLPPLPVQRQIVAVLEQVEAVKRQRKEADALTVALLQSVFREMFGDPVRNEKGWPLKNIKEFSAPNKNAIKAGPFGSSLKKECYTKTGFKIYGQEQVIKDDLQFGDYYISHEKYQELINYSVQAGDILISLVGSYGKISIVPESFEQGIINPRLMKISLNQEYVLPIFFKQLFLTEGILNQIEGLSHGGTMDIINVGIVKQLKFLVPPLSLQQQFARIVESVERIRDQQVASGRQIEGLCEGLMQRAFAGELVA